jgi:hypothetical protein
MYYGCNLNNVICAFLTAIKQAQLFSLNFSIAKQMFQFLHILRATPM